MRARVLLTALILVQVFALEHALLRFEWFPIVIGGIAVAGLPGFLQVRFRRNALIVATVAIAATIYVGTTSFLFTTRLPVLPFLPDYLYPAGWCLFALQAGALFVRWRDGLPRYLPIFGIVTMAHAGLSTHSDPLDPRYHVAALIYVLLASLYWMPPPPRRSIDTQEWRGTALRGVLLALAIAIAASTSLGIGMYRNQIDQAFMNLVTRVAQDQVGFSQESRLTSISRMRSKDSAQVALYVNATTTPGYLRGRAYDRYEGSRWTITPQSTPLPPAQRAVSGATPAAGVTYYAVREDGPAQHFFEVEPAQRYADTLFAPLGTTTLGLRHGAPALDSNDNLFASDGAEEAQYTVTARRGTPGAAPAQEFTPWLQIPQDLDPGVHALASRLLAKCNTTQEKCAAVVEYFDQNYQYQLGIKIPAGKDPISYFLLEHPPAHCEYFATGAVMLLRIAGVPARYVTGFVAAERNSFGGYWVARNRDAHAWVEAYDDAAHAWVTVEATVAAGVPNTDEQPGAGKFRQLMEAVRFVLHKLKITLLGIDWRALLAEPRVWLVALLAIIAGFAWRWWRARRKKVRRALEVLSPQLRALVQLRRQMDRRARRHGFVRKEDEPVGAFAQRIATAADAVPQEQAAALQHIAAWYQRYNAARFNGEVAAAEIAALRADLR